MTVHAVAVEDLEPLVALCRSGKLFEVEEWIETGKPVALPKDSSWRSAKRNPLRIAIDAGFHSLVQVLLEAGAPIREGNYDALEHAVETRRADLAALLLAHGADVSSVSMRFVIETWEPEMVDLFVANGASLVRGNPIAWGLIHKIRPTLGLLKRYAPEHPELLRQADLALRHHAAEGNSKWVALTLWAGADPWARGPYWLDDTDLDDHEEDAEPEDDEEDAGYRNALELALMCGHIDVLKQKKLRAALDPGHPESARLIEEACHAPDGEPLSLLLELGHGPGQLPDHGTRAISWLLHSMSSDFYFGRTSVWSSPNSDGGIDSSHARERLKMLHMIVSKGAKWLPADKRAIGDSRRCLLKMARPYVLEFAWLMQHYEAARRRDVQELLRTPAMTRLLSKERNHAASIVAGIPGEPLHTM